MGNRGVVRERRPYCTKIFEIRKRKKCSLHYRKLKTESFYRHGGKRLVRIKKSPESATIEEFELVAGELHRVPIGLVHQMEALEDAELFEFLTGTSTATRFDWWCLATEVAPIK